MDAAFRHEALLYAGEREFVDATASFIRDGVAAGEPVLVVVGAAKIDRLTTALGRDAAQVQFADMAEVGTNPARIIPAWRDFVGDRTAADGPMRGVGEPIWADRTPAELIECQRHESLLNLAFADAPAWRLLCPYDTESLDSSVIAEAHRSHPFVAEHGAAAASRAFVGVETCPTRFDEPLPAPRTAPCELDFDGVSLEPVRRLVAQQACEAGLERFRADDLVVAVTELASNSVRHGGGGGALRVWPDGDTFICEVHDAGYIADPLAGRRRPPPTTEGGRGLWLVNQLCDLVQVRSAADRTTVRVHMHTP
jgi:anti-sigma regulatory factor (Ser/Thr protein kinase)